MFVSRKRWEHLQDQVEELRKRVVSLECEQKIHLQRNMMPGLYLHRDMIPSETIRDVVTALANKAGLMRVGWTQSHFEFVERVVIPSATTSEKPEDKKD